MGADGGRCGVGGGLWAGAGLGGCGRMRAGVVRGRVPAWQSQEVWRLQLSVQRRHGLKPCPHRHRPSTARCPACPPAGPDAPLALERGLSATHMAHAYDFYKPSGLYPAVDGPLSVYCYLDTLDACYARYAAKFERRFGRAFSLLGGDADHALFHAPYNKLVQKAFARLCYQDLCRCGGGVGGGGASGGGGGAGEGGERQAA